MDGFIHRTGIVTLSILGFLFVAQPSAAQDDALPTRVAKKSSIAGSLPALRDWINSTRRGEVKQASTTPAPSSHASGTKTIDPRTPLPASLFNGTYHGRLVEANDSKLQLASFGSQGYDAAGPAGGKEPDIGPEGTDPWDLARRLGIADNSSYPIPESMRHDNLARQSAADAFAKSEGCIQCHANVGNMHPENTVQIGCTDCHGGNAQTLDKKCAHVQPTIANVWKSSANPVRSYTLLNHESPEFVRFVNPGDLRVAHIACGQCHANEVLQLRKSMMTHGCMLWGAALYNNGGTASKQPQFGESYSMKGAPQRMQTVPLPTAEETRTKGILASLDPLYPYQVSQPGNTLRIFERGGRFRPEIGIPERTEEPGRPRERLSNRGMGTENRTDPVYIGLAKTRLLDPTLNFMGTNDHAGDYRSSGCSACHVLYANDRSRTHSGFTAKYGNRGTAAAEVDDWVKTIDPTIPKDEPGHPIQHKFELRMPTSQCIA